MVGSPVLWPIQPWPWPLLMSGYRQLRETAGECSMAHLGPDGAFRCALGQLGRKLGSHCEQLGRGAGSRGSEDAFTAMGQTA